MPSDSALLDELDRLQPAELLFEEDDAEETELPDEILELLGPLGSEICLTGERRDTSARRTPASMLSEHFETTSLAGFGCEELTAGIGAAGALLPTSAKPRRARSVTSKGLPPSIFRIL